MSEWYLRLPLSDKPDPRILTNEVRKRARIGVSHWNAKLQRIPNRFSYKAVIRRYIKDLHLYEPEGLGMILYGAVGTGKTALASIILKNALARGGRALSVRASELVDASVSKHPILLPNGAPLTVAARQVNFLLIDDFACETLDWRLRMLEDIVRARYDEQLPTLITTNEKNDLFAIEWLKSVIFQSFDGVEIKGIDWRRRPPAV